MGDTGWTVADTARLNSGAATKKKKKTTTFAVPQDEPSNGQSAQSHGHVRWSDSLRRTQSEEDLDKLLDGLEELTETLPDLANAVERGTRKKQPPPPSRSYLPQQHQQESSSIVSPSSGNSTDQIPSKKNSVRSPISASPSVNPILSASRNSSAPVIETNGESKSVPVVSSDQVDISDYVGGPTSDPRLNPNGPVFPSVRKTRQLLSSSRERGPGSEYGYGTMDGSGSYSNGQSNGTSSMRQPYHTMQDSKPFSYIHTNGGNSNRAMSRTSSRETLSNHGAGLESPSLLRKILNPNSGINGTFSDTDSRPMSPASTASSRIVPIQTPEAAAPTVTVNVSFTPSTPTYNNGGLNKSSSSNGFQYSSSQQQQQSVPIAVTRSTSSDNNNSAKYQSAYTMEVSHNGESDSEATSSWLGRQQQKLQERREVERRRLTKGGGLSPINPPSLHSSSTLPGHDMMHELKSSLHSARSETTARTEDYASDLASNLYSETSTRESSPHKNMNNVYNVPLKVDSGFQHKQAPQPAARTTLNTSSSSNNYSNSSSYNNNNNASTSYKTTKTMTVGRPTHPTTIETNFYSPSSASTQHGMHTSTPRQQPQQQQQQSNSVSLSRQKSDSSFDRMRPFISRRLRYDSESEAEQMQEYIMRNGAGGTMGGRGSNGMHGSNTSIDSALQWGMAGGCYSQPGSRPITPAFPQMSGTPYFNQSAGSGTMPGRNGRPNGHALFQQRSHSPAGSLYNQGHESSRRGSISSEPAEVSPMHVKLVKESHKFWYKPSIGREDAIRLLESRSPGTFVVRDSNSFPGAFGLALKVATPPAPSQTKSGEASSELVRHFLIEPTSKGVKLKGYNNEPVFASLSALVYQHTLTQLALPTRLVLPQSDLGGGVRDSSDSRASNGSQMAQLLQQGAACNVHYLFTLDTDTLTGPEAIKKTVTATLASRPKPTLVHFKVSAQGITLTDNARKLFFRKHYNTSAVTFCGTDPDDRRWSTKDHGSNKVFAFVAKKHHSRSANQCHVFAEADSDQPAKAIVNFVNKVLLSGGGSSSSSRNHHGGKDRV